MVCCVCVLWCVCVSVFVFCFVYEIAASHVVICVVLLFVIVCENVWCVSVDVVCVVCVVVDVFWN